MASRKGARVVVRRSSFSHPKSCIDKFVANHPFNSALQVLLPDDVDKNSILKLDSAFDAESSVQVIRTAHDVPNPPTIAADSVLNLQQNKVVNQINGRGYSTVRCNIAIFLDTEFLERHVRGECARFSALSVNTPIDRTDVAAILPDGDLVLSVTRSTYERLGVVGKHASHDPGNHLILLLDMDA